MSISASSRSATRQHASPRSVECESDELETGLTSRALLRAALEREQALLLKKNDLLRRQECQSAFKFDPRSASNFDPFWRRVLAVALAPSELVGVAETVRARAA